MIGLFGFCLSHFWFLFFFMCCMQVISKDVQLRKLPEKYNLNPKNPNGALLLDWLRMEKLLSLKIGTNKKNLKSKSDLKIIINFSQQLIAQLKNNKNNNNKNNNKNNNNKNNNKNNNNNNNNNNFNNKNNNNNNKNNNRVVGFPGMLPIGTRPSNQTKHKIAITPIQQKIDVQQMLQLKNNADVPIPKSTHFSYFVVLLLLFHLELRLLLFQNYVCYYFRITFVIILELCCYYCCFIQKYVVITLVIILGLCCYYCWFIQNYVTLVIILELCCYYCCYYCLFYFKLCYYYWFILDMLLSRLLLFQNYVVMIVVNNFSLFFFFVVLIDLTVDNFFSLQFLKNRKSGAIMNVWRILETQKIEVPKQKWGQFWSKESCKRISHFFFVVFFFIFIQTITNSKQSCC